MKIQKFCLGYRMIMITFKVSKPLLVLLNPTNDKEVFSDSNNIILWHESERINKQTNKKLISKILADSNSMFSS